MVCPRCGEPESKVLDSRVVRGGAVVRRRRACDHCRARFTTYEACEVAPLFVVKRSGAREPFDPEKLLAKLALACNKRPVAIAPLQEEVDAIEVALREQGLPEVDSRYIGRLALDALARIDDVAYVRFASVYLEFQSVDDFRRVLDAKGGVPA